jgi:predicted transcriptional regulator
VEEFKQLSREAIPLAAPRTHYSKKPVPRTVLFVSEKNTFEDVIRKMDDGNIHRVFVCSQLSINRGQPEPLHVISQTDVLKQVFNHYTWSFL